MENVKENTELMFTLINEKIENAVAVVNSKISTSSMRLVDYFALLYLISCIIWIIKIILNSLFNNLSYKGPIFNYAFRKLRKACYKNDTSAILYWLNFDPSLVNTKMDKYGYTPFLRACFNGNTDVVKAMLQLGADICDTTIREENAFYLAVSNRIKNMGCRDSSCIHALAYTGVDIDKPNSVNISPIQLAAMFGHFKLIHWLKEKGANTDVHPSINYLSMNNGFPQLERIYKLKSTED